MEQKHRAYVAVDNISYMRHYTPMRMNFPKMIENLDDKAGISNYKLAEMVGKGRTWAWRIKTGHITTVMYEDAERLREIYIEHLGDKVPMIRKRKSAA